MARTPKPPYLKGLDAQAKAALSPRLKELPPPPAGLSTAERLVWLEVVASIPQGLFGGEAGGTLRLLRMNQVYLDRFAAELTLLETKRRLSAKERERCDWLHRKIRMTSSTWPIFTTSWA